MKLPFNFPHPGSPPQLVGVQLQARDPDMGKKERGRRRKKRGKKEEDGSAIVLVPAEKGVALQLEEMKCRKEERRERKKKGEQSHSRILNSDETRPVSFRGREEKKGEGKKKKFVSHLLLHSLQARSA